MAIEHKKEYKVKELDRWGRPIYRILEREVGSSTWLVTLGQPDFDEKWMAEFAKQGLDTHKCKC